MWGLSEHRMCGLWAGTAFPAPLCWGQGGRCSCCLPTAIFADKIQTDGGPWLHQRRKAQDIGSSWKGELVYFPA